MDFFFKFRNICPKIQIFAYLYVRVQNLVKIGRSAAELLRIFDFQNGGSQPSWFWYDGPPRLVFDGPNILIKLYVDRVYTLQDIAIFIFGTVGYSRPLLGFFLGDITSK